MTPYCIQKKFSNSQTLKPTFPAISHFYPSTGFNHAFLIPILLTIHSTCPELSQIFPSAFIVPLMYNHLTFPYPGHRSSRYQPGLISNLPSSMTSKSFQSSHIFTLYFPFDNLYMYFYKMWLSPQTVRL